MTKMSTAKKMKKGFIPAEVLKRNFTPQEVIELQEMQRLVNMRKFESQQIKNNTALVPRGKEVAEEIEAIARLLENIKNQYVGDKLVECGYAGGVKCDINFTNGEITLHNES